MTQQIAKKDDTLKGLLTGENFKLQIATALPKHLSPERFIRVALTAMTKTPKLKDCTKESFFQSLLSLSQAGLEPDGRNAHLIPYGNVCQLIIDYKGLVDLAMRSGTVASIHADKVCENDTFEVDRGAIKKHCIDYRNPRGAAYAYYALITFKDGGEKAEVMTIDEVESIRNRSKAGKNGPWVSDFDEMAKKTVFRRASKWIQLSPEFRDVLEADDDKPEDIRFAAAKPVFSASAAPSTPFDAPKAVEPIPATEPDDIPMGDDEPPMETPAREKFLAMVEREGLVPLKVENALRKLKIFSTGTETLDGISDSKAEIALTRWASVKEEAAK